MPESTPRRWWRNWKLWSFCFSLVVLLFHAPLLRFFIHRLIVNETMPDHVDAVVLSDGDYAAEKVAEWVESGYTDKVLLNVQIPYRTDLHGITTPSHLAKEQHLIRLGVPREKIIHIGNPTDKGEWREARSIADWMEGKPDSQVVVLGPRIKTSQARFAINHALDKSQSQQVFVYGLKHQTFEVDQWWKSREGWKEFFNATIDDQYGRWIGEDTIDRVSWSIDEYEKDLMSQGED